MLQARVRAEPAAGPGGGRPTPLSHQHRDRNRDAPPTVNPATDNQAANSRHRSSGLPQDEQGWAPPKEQRRWPLEPLVTYVRRHYGVPTEAGFKGVARAIGVTDRTMSRWKQRGYLSDLQADHAAVSAGVHPANVWVTWFGPRRGQATPRAADVFSNLRDELAAATSEGRP